MVGVFGGCGGGGWFSFAIVSFHEELLFFTAFIPLCLGPYIFLVSFIMEKQ